jgi:hypothetical protein
MANEKELSFYSRILDAVEKKVELRHIVSVIDVEEQHLRIQLIIAFHMMLGDRQDDSLVYLGVHEGPLTYVDHVLFQMPMLMLSKKLNEVTDVVILKMPPAARVFVRKILEA